MLIRDANSEDAARIAEIYNHYIRETIITFEETVVDADEMRRRWLDKTNRGFPWIVIENKGRVIGYAYADQWRARIAYRHSVEAAVYLDHQSTGLGAGSAIYRALMDRLIESKTVHAVVAGISLPNDVSVALHRKLGFEEVGVFPDVGRKFGSWIDVMFLQRTLDCEPVDPVK